MNSSRADWVRSTYITDDTEILAAKADERTIGAQVQFAKDATRFDRVKLPEDLARKIMLLKLSLTLATPANPKESEELTNIVSKMEDAYGKGKYCPKGTDKCLDLDDLSRIHGFLQGSDFYYGRSVTVFDIRTDVSRLFGLALAFGFSPRSIYG